MISDLDAFGAVNFDWTRHLRSVWEDAPYHVPALQQQLVDEIVSYFELKTRDTDPVDEPLGRVINGPAGFGKTHLIGELRRQVWAKQGWFVLLDFIGVKDFWASVALGFLNSLQIRVADGQTQGHCLTLRLARLLGVEQKLIPTADRWRAQSRDLMLKLVRFFTDSFAHKYPSEALQHRDVVTALVLLASDSYDCQSIAHGWLQGMALDGQEVRDLGFKENNTPRRVVEGMSWIMSRTAPTLIAVDQIDGIVTATNLQALAANGDAQEQKESQAIVEHLALGLLDLHELKRRAVTVISCLEATWHILKQILGVPVQDRYKPSLNLQPVNHADLARALVRARLAPAYAKQGFQPPFETWPFDESAFSSALGLSPRGLLKACSRHQDACIASGKVTVCTSFVDVEQTPPETVDDTAVLDSAYSTALKQADVSNLMDTGSDEKLGTLLEAALRLLEKHYDLPDNVDSEVRRDPDQKRPALHGRLSFTFLGEGSREAHYCFRLLRHSQALAFQTRLKAAMTASGIDQKLRFRHLSILRRDPPPSGPKTADLVEQFRKLGGQFIAPSDDDLRAFVALTAMDVRKLPGFEAWLRKAQPLFNTELFQKAGLCPPPFLATKTKKPPLDPPAAAAIPVGRRYEHGALGGNVALTADLLPRHIAVLAGPGSGKTVFVRRIVEEAALLGIPSIVLDPNNDLSRLGDIWPTHPDSWTDEDADKAKRYHDCADVVIWTPGVSSGNPISLSLLPDFSSIDDQDERDQAIGMALTTLTPLLPGGGTKAYLKKGVLADALRRFAATQGGALSDLIALLDELPDGVSQVKDAAKLARDIADELRTAVAINPLLSSTGEPLDPKTLFQGPTGKTRVSVINLAGLADEDARDSFVNRLQMSLFTFIKKRPSGTGYLYVIDEAQNFAPSSTMTACKASALSLAAQARKYGLGMIFATQTPKGVDNKLVSNATTHVYGRMNAPVTIDAIWDLMAAKGGTADDIGKLSKGEFYFSTEGSPRPFKIRTPLCLSWHSQNPPTAEEVVQKARAKHP